MCYKNGVFQKKDVFFISLFFGLLHLMQKFKKAVKNNKKTEKRLKKYIIIIMLTLCEPEGAIPHA